MKQVRKSGTDSVRGFSLVEVMIALLVVGIALGAVVFTVSVSARNEAIITNKTLARWVALNQISKVKLEHAWPGIGESNGDETMAGVKWKWTQKTLSTMDENVRRLEVSVWPETQKKDGISVTVVGFLVKG